MSTEKYEPTQDSGIDVQKKADMFINLMRGTRKDFSGGRTSPLDGSPFIIMLNQLEQLDDPTKDVLRQNSEVLEIITDWETRRDGPLPEYGKRVRTTLGL